MTGGTGGAQRDTPLRRIFKARIARDGPMPVAEYVSTCLADPEHGYYRRQTAIGRSGDFITAPEISQIFGELIGLWSVIVWQQMGSPERFHLIELGPGRGTLMRDALRSAKVMPAFLAAAQPVLVDINDAFVALQRDTLRDIAPGALWVRTLDDVSLSAPAVVIANEFLDTFPLHQAVMTDDGLRTRVIGLDAAGELCFSTGPAAPETVAAEITRTHQALAPGDIIGLHDFGSLLAPLSMRLSAAPLAALFIDYGHVASAPGDTLQAVRRHTAEHPLQSPGEADLTAHVDFEVLSRAFSSLQTPDGRVLAGVDGPVTQAEFLGALGIVERASRLMAANPHRAAEIEAAVARLIAPTGMGSRFKAIGLRSASLAALPGLSA
jgi:SAM-dependent MidA family methyltransferase